MIARKQVVSKALCQGKLLSVLGWFSSVGKYSEWESLWSLVFSGILLKVGSACLLGYLGLKRLAIWGPWVNKSAGYKVMRHGGSRFGDAWGHIWGPLIVETHI